MISPNIVRIHLAHSGTAVIPARNPHPLFSSLLFPPNNFLYALHIIFFIMMFHYQLPMHLSPTQTPDLVYCIAHLMDQLFAMIDGVMFHEDAFEGANVAHEG